LKGQFDFPAKGRLVARDRLRDGSTLGLPDVFAALMIDQTIS